jgi:hypothetical protein
MSGYRKARDRRLVRRHLRDTDVFLLGHPKSGNTWVAYVLGIVINRDFDGTLTLANVGRYVPVMHGKDWEIEVHESLKNPRIFRSEWPVYPELYPKVIYLVRDPRAVLVSYYHMYRTVTDDTETTLRSFVTEYLAAGCVARFEPNIRWDVQVGHWQRRAQETGSVKLVRYEDMLADRATVISQMLTFMNLSPSDDLLRLAVERSDIDSMKKVEEAHGAESYARVRNPKNAFIRLGRADSWKEEMDIETIHHLESELGAMMTLMGYQLTRA